MCWEPSAVPDRPSAVQVGQRMCRTTNAGSGPIRTICSGQRALKSRLMTCSIGYGLRDHISSAQLVWHTRRAMTGVPAAVFSRRPLSSHAPNRPAGLIWAYTNQASSGLLLPTLISDAVPRVLRSRPPQAPSSAAGRPLPSFRIQLIVV